MEELERSTRGADGGAGTAGGSGRGEPSPLSHFGGTPDDAAAGIKATIAKGEAPSKNSVVALYTLFGMKPADAVREYERQLAEWNQSRAGGGTRPS